MKRLTKILTLTAFFLLAAMAEAQVTNPSVRYVAVAPSGACSQSPPVQVVNSSGALCTCASGTWSCSSGAPSSGVTDGAGTTTLGLVAQSTGTAHVQTYSSALYNGTTAATQSQADGSTKLATTAYVDTGLAGKQASGTYVTPTTLSNNTLAASVTTLTVGGIAVPVTNAIGCLDGYDHAPCVVARATYTNHIAPIAYYTTLYTPTVAGEYRIVAALATTTAGTGIGTLALNAVYHDVNGAEHDPLLTGGMDLTTQIDGCTPGGLSSSDCNFPVYSNAGGAIGYWTTLSIGATVTGYTYGLGLYLEYVGP